jgi:hypothetical protein
MLLIGENGEAFNGAFVQDPFARFMKVLTIIGAVVTLAMSVSVAEREKLDKFEFPVLIVLSTLGMLLMISADNMLTLYMGLELQSLALYVVAAFNRDSARATEAGLKYFVLGALSSGMLLYGISLIYGYTGNTGFAANCGGARRGGAPARRGVRPCLCVGGAGLQDIGCAVPYVDAGRLRGRADAGDRLLCGCAKNGGDGASGACCVGSIQADSGRLAADCRVHFDRLDGAWRVRRHRPAKHQAADGLFVDWPYGLCACGVCRRQRESACAVSCST